MASYRLCSVPGCDKPTLNSRGWCNAHYLRWRRWGNPTDGRTPEGEPLRYLREVVLVHDSDECLTWPFASTCGYGYIRLDGRAQRVIRIVCENAHGAPPSAEHEAAHSCGNGHLGCVSPKHLSWKTPKENNADKVVHGTHLRGERAAGAKLSESDILEIRSLKGKMLQREIAETFGICSQNVSMIHHGKRWGWL